MFSSVLPLIYLIAAVLFILSLQGLSSAKTAVKGLECGQMAMAISIIFTIAIYPLSMHSLLILPVGAAIGFAIAHKIEMTSLPQLVAAFHSLIGMAAVLIALSVFIEPEMFNLVLADGSTKSLSMIEMSLGAAIGAITATGSVVAFAKLANLIKASPTTLPSHNMINLALGTSILVAILLCLLIPSIYIFSFIIIASLILGVLLVIPIGGADMPVIVSMLNSYSGFAAAGIGFTLHNQLLIITGALVGSSGAILSYIMCNAMNRSFINVLLGGFGNSDDVNANQGAGITKADVVQGAPSDAAFLLEQASSVIIVPGFGMAVAKAQHIIKEIVNSLKAKDIEVRFAIHPVAGRMPGHMNVLLAEADIDYDDVLELEQINNDFKSTDVVIVIGANDITNPLARHDKTSPIYGMPILDVDKARQILFVKRSLSPGYAGIDNPLFADPKTMMLFGDAKAVCEEISQDLSKD